MAKRRVLNSQPASASGPMLRVWCFCSSAGMACRSSIARLARGRMHLPYSVGTMPL
ncbi:Uncharacterised protein [Klebsiella pneumoniae subsp. ozaenae]|uniref:Uncharacterized protein n=1 Tax=Klebsiella pneumoniae subsp. ozaenae TaxID=574 RepID=A0A378ASQ7_KLEPO|nr:Uncharacterised protein [Klebsiella pneumoniae subsp. ozaenae]